ncbi:MAG TPA: substrate-binding domain-containing protein, partial [Ktedonobacteraceae bacterium]|nr:substrate-binding domain-containing protein [Ktedonobacteraceae bacterium]
DPHLEFVSGILEVTSQRNYSLLLQTTPNENQEILSMIRQGFIDGLILMEIKLEDPRVVMLKEHNYPFTMIGHCSNNEGINFVDLDFDYALHTCVNYLADLGHTHMAFINNASELLEKALGYVVRSEQAFHHALTQRKLEGISYFCGPESQSGYDAAQTLLREHPELTAIITSNAWVSGGITRAVYDKGLKIPEDLSLVGIVSSHIAELTTPQLTTLDFPFHEMGRLGADMLIRQLENEEVSTQLLLTPPLTIRQSSGSRAK